MNYKKINRVYILVFVSAVMIMLYPYISSVLYQLLGDVVWGSKGPEAVIGRPSPFNNVTLDVKNFNKSVATFSKMKFYNKVSPIVIGTAIINILYRPFALKFLINQRNFKKIFIIELAINFTLITIVILMACIIWIVDW